jgi:hypothetical protein
MNAPKIHIITPNAEKEIDLFNKFLNHPIFPQHRNMIFSAFPDLQNSLKNTPRDEEENIVREFIFNFYKENDEKIQKIALEASVEANEKMLPALKELAVLMDYEWKDGHPGYTAIPTILPFSPFEKDLFYFSILGELRGTKGKGVSFIGIHEISHFILFDTLASIYERNFEKELGTNLLYFLKEILAPVLMNQPTIAKILSVENYSGNQNFKEIYILNENNEKVQISRYFQRFYEKARSENKKFTDIVKEMILLLRSIQNEIDLRQKMWNENGPKIFQDDPLLQKYSEGIKITPQ